jgi:hypothetical protein
MSKIIPVEFLDDENIVKILIISENHVQRVRIHFKNAYQLSVIIGVDPELDLTYGARNGLYEIAIFDKEGKMINIEDNGTVLGNCDIAEVKNWIKKVGEYV